MYRTRCPSVLLATLVVVAAWLATPSLARAGYVSIKYPLGRVDAPEPLAYGQGGAGAADQLPTDLPDQNWLRKNSVPLWALATLGGAPQSGAGMPSGPFGSGPGASGQAAGPIHKPTIPADESVDRLAPESESLLPPPHAARLFRPPRDSR